MFVCSAMGRKWGTTVGHSGGKDLSHVPRFWHHCCLASLLPGRAGADSGLTGRSHLTVSSPTDES